ncbi:hypothetical protein BCM0060_0731 [Bacillus cereus]|nr:hypothetical protein BCM0060_0731 [Bacillus cereus]
MVYSFWNCWVHFIIIQNILSNRNVTNKMRMNRGNYLQEWTGITNLFGWKKPAD